MPTYYGHKPSWKQRGSSGGARSAAPPVLETSRSPSGEYSFSGDIYTPPVNRGGRSPVPSVPRSGGGTRYPSEERIMNAWQNAQLAKALLSGGIGAASALAEAVLDPNTQQAIADYGWDDFMKGDLPPPFDFLNPDPNWMDQFGGAPMPVTQQDKLIPAAGSTSVGFYGFLIPANGGVNVSRSVLGRIEAGAVAAWNPYFYGFAGGARGTADLLANLGVKGVTSATFGWNFHEVYGTFSQSPIAVSVAMDINTQRLGKPFVWSSPVALGPTEAEALAKAALMTARTLPYVRHPTTGVITKSAAAPVAVAPAYLPLWYSRGQIPYANLLKQLAGLQVRDVVTEDDYLGAEPGGKVIIPPKGPILVVPGEPLPHPPGPDTKEKKARVGLGLFKVAQQLFHGITEYGDAVDALFDAIPKEKRCKTKSLVGKSACVFMHLDDVDVGDAIVNLAWNQFEDYVIGTQLFGRNQRAAQARGDRYAFRTMNSVNGFGGVDDLGELYGDFSKEYINPRKDDLKKFLTDRFGI